MIGSEKLSVNEANKRAPSTGAKLSRRVGQKSQIPATETSHFYLLIPESSAKLNFVSAVDHALKKARSAVRASANLF